MLNEPTPEHAALLLIAAASLNTLNAAMRGLGQLQTKDKKLQKAWPELARLSARTYTRLALRLDGPSGDYLNSLSNANEAIMVCLAQLPVGGMEAIVHDARIAVAVQAQTEPAA